MVCVGPIDRSDFLFYISGNVKFADTSVQSSIMRLIDLRSFALLLLCSLAIGCSSKADSSTSVFLLEGMEYPVFYTSTRPLEKGDDGETAAIVIQGWGGGVQVLKEQLALQQAIGDVYVLSPLYPRTMIMERHGIEPDGRVVWNDSWPKDLTIPGTPDDDWRGGGDANGTQLSSFDVIDTLLSRLSDRRHFPNLKKIALIGFSAGGQFVGRYVAVGRGEAGPGIILRYAAMSPSTYLIPEPDATWHYGLAERPRYSSDLSRDQIMQNLRSRYCFHACGKLDTLEKSLDKTPWAMKQGTNRFTRFQNFRQYVSQDTEWSSVTTFHVFDSIGHSAVSAYADPVFVDYIMQP